MEQPAKLWKKKVQGNRDLHTVKNPLRNFIQKVLPSIQFSEYPDRPKEQVNLSIGDPSTSPDYRTHPQNLAHIAECVGKVDGYTYFQGLESAREAVIKKFGTKSHELTTSDVFLTAGGSMALWASMNLLSGTGDNYLFPSPGFPLSLTIAQSMGLTPKHYHLQADDNWQADISEMEKLVDDKTKFVLVNDPSNPLGSVWSAEHKRQIIEMCIRKKLPLVADQIYEEMSYETQAPTFAQLIKPEEVDKITVFKCSGLTKRYLAPGWRMGWVIIYGSKQAQECYRNAMKGLFNIILMNTTIMQVALPGILSNKNNDIRMHERMEMMGVNQQTLRQGLKDEPYCRCGQSSGALYATIIMKLDHFDQEKIKDMQQFCKLMFAEQNVMLFPGQFFEGETPFVRLVISCSKQRIEEFLVRFKRFCRSHLKK